MRTVKRGCGSDRLRTVRETPTPAIKHRPFAGLRLWDRFNIVGGSQSRFGSRVAVAFAAMTGQESLREQAVQTIHCSNCTDNFDFDPKTVWTSPGTFHGPQPGILPAVGVRRPKMDH